ncbi:hypothetical protein FOZ63_019322 [Perkinsus olseni]|uniref:Uncharacterized protein n=1 Tax=Perkinsus olseni TaxID=32597 RepID=A0A7J6QB25_PEROL|nr:hypothetical protein FOZ63_019322 [Perkinsus olseni]
MVWAQELSQYSPFGSTSSAVCPVSPAATPTTIMETKNILRLHHSFPRSPSCAALSRLFTPLYKTLVTRGIVNNSYYGASAKSILVDKISKPNSQRGSNALLL